jgi:hypothetical protein
MNARYKQSLDAQVLEQLQIAHAVILNAVALMTSEQKARWNKANVSSGVHFEDGITGADARQKVIARATWEHGE